MSQTEFEDEADILKMYLEQFEQLEREAPEVAQRLGFAGYVQFKDARFYQNERFNQLESLAHTVDGLKRTAG